MKINKLTRDANEEFSVKFKLIENKAVYCKVNNYFLFDIFIV